jgi:hypothetical protein
MSQMAMEEVRSPPMLPVELREMIWKHYALSTEPMTHIVSRTPTYMKSSANGCRLVSLPMPDAVDMRTIRNLVQVSREVRFAVLNKRKVFQFARPLEEMACVYGWKSKSIHDGRTCRTWGYSSVFVDWEKDLFYFPYSLDLHESTAEPVENPRHLPLEDPRHLMQDPNFRANAQHVAFDGIFTHKWLSHFRMGVRPSKRDFQRFIDLNGGLMREYSRSLPSLRSVRLVVGSEDIMDMNSTSMVTAARRYSMKKVGRDQHGFCDPPTASAVIKHPNCPQVFSDFCRDLKDAVEKSMDTSPHIHEARVPGETGGADEAKSGASNEPIDFRIMVDHLGEWDYEFRGYNRATNLRAPPRFV